MHSRRPTEQYFYCGCLHKVKKVHWHPLIKESQWSHKNENCAGTASLKRANGAIILENGLVPPP